MNTYQIILSGILALIIITSSDIRAGTSIDKVQNYVNIFIDVSKIGSENPMKKIF